METINNKTGLYLLNCGNALTSWKKWQCVAFEYAQSLDHYLFSRNSILNLYAELVKVASCQRNYIPGSIRDPDFDFSERYNTSVLLGIGESCSLSFIPVAGYYQGAGQSYGTKAQKEE